jgi:hypothetical protein
MIRVLPEGEVSRWGINLHIYEGKLEAVTFKVCRRLAFRLGSVWSRGLWLDLTLDHKMYREPDKDVALICRRCRDYSNAARSHCRGRIFAWVKR